PVISRSPIPARSASRDRRSAVGARTPRSTPTRSVRPRGVCIKRSRGRSTFASMGEVGSTWHRNRYRVFGWTWERAMTRRPAELKSPSDDTAPDAGDARGRGDRDDGMQQRRTDGGQPDAADTGAAVDAFRYAGGPARAWGSSPQLVRGHRQYRRARSDPDRRSNAHQWRPRGVRDRDRDRCVSG